MATNQVIHGSNRVVENPNRYKLNAVSGQANTYDLEKVPGVITDNGTPYNKSILDKIDNVLSYLTPSVEKVEDPTHIIMTESELKSYAGSQSNTGNYIGSIQTDLYNDLEINYKFSSIYDGSSSALTDWSESQLNSVFSYLKTATEFSNYYRFNLNVYEQHTRYLKFDFKRPLHIKINCIISKSQNCSFKYGIDSADTDIILESSSSAKSYTIEFYGRYLEIVALNNNGTEFYGFNLMIGKYAYQNQFTLDNNGNTFANNQRVLIETAPNIVDIVKTQSNIIVNTLNNTWGGTTALTSNTLSGSLKSDDINWNSTYEWKTNAKNGFYNNQGTLITRACVWTKVSGTPYTTSEKFLDQEKRKTYSSNSYTEFDIDKHISVQEGVETFITKTFDLLVPSKIKLYYRIYFSNLSSAVIEGSMII